MNGANHRMNCATTCPFYIMGGDWGNALACINIPEEARIIGQFPALSVSG